MKPPGVTTRNQGYPVTMLALLATLVAMIVATLTALGVVNEKYAQYSAPGLHTEVWQSYQLLSETRQLVETAERTLAQDASPLDLIQRIGVVQSLLPPLQRTTVFDYLDEPHDEIVGTLATLERSTANWASRLTWQDTSQAERVARDIATQLPPLLAPTHRIIVAANIAVANQLDSERQDLRRTFQALAWTLLILGAGCIPLIFTLFRDHFSTRRLTRELAALNQTLEQRVVERTQRLNERKALLGTILDSSPSDVVLVGADDPHIYYVSDRLRQLSPTPDRFQFGDLFVDPHQHELFEKRLHTRQPLDHWEAQLGPSAPYWAQLSVRYLQLESQPAWLIWSLDITERKRMERELKRLAETDALTGLPNRRTFLRQSVKQLSRTQRDDKPCSALAIDIDLFKRINDTHGHQVGDSVLREVAQRLSQHMQDIGLLGRLGGEEFAALLPGAEEDDAWRIAEALRQDIETWRHRTARGQIISVTISIGIATQRQHGSTKHLLMRADEALYRAKVNGRNRSETGTHQASSPPIA